MCYLPTPQNLKPEPGERTRKLIKDVKDLFEIDLKPLKSSLLYAEQRGVLEFTYFGKGQIRIDPETKQPYNCILKIVGEEFHYFIEKHPEQLKLWNGKH